MGRLTLLRPDGTQIDLGTAEDQVFSFQDEEGTQYHWSVQEARKRAEDHCVLGVVCLKEAGMTPDRLRQLYQGLDEDYAMTTDLSRPLLILPLDGKHVLADGWHRAFRAAMTGVDILPCYVLSEEDAEACLIVKLPPGRGLSWNEQEDRDKRKEARKKTPPDGRRA